MAHDSQVPSSAPAAELQPPADAAKPLLSPQETKDQPGASTKTAVAPLQEPTKQQESIAADVHGYMRGFIASADQKAAFFFAATTAVLAFLHSKQVAMRWLRNPNTWSFTDALACLATLGLLGGAVVLLAAVFPRLGGDQRGILFFKAISKYGSAAQYADDVFARSDIDLIRTRLQHAYDLSRVCAAKFLLLQIGFWVGSVGLVAALVFFALS